MKKLLATGIIILFGASLMLPALAATTSDLRQVWLQAQQTRLADDAVYRQAQIDYQKEKTPENDKKVVDSAKALMDAALDEVAAWLKWKDGEAQGDPRVPATIKTAISADVAANLAKIAGYRSDVAAIQTRVQVGTVFLKLVGGYTGLLADVARNTGSLWVVVGNSWLDTAESYEAKLRTAADSISDNAEIITALDTAKSAIDRARANVAAAETAYAAVRLPGTPLIKFAEGNAALRLARTNLLEAQAQLLRAFTLIGSRTR